MRKKTPPGVKTVEIDADSEVNIKPIRLAWTKGTVYCPFCKQTLELNLEIVRYVRIPSRVFFLNSEHVCEVMA